MICWHVTTSDCPYKAKCSLWIDMKVPGLIWLKKCLIESPIHKYTDPEKPYTLFTDASKYAWACVLTQAYDHIIEGKERTILDPFIYVSHLFWGSQLGCSY